MRKSKTHTDFTERLPKGCGVPNHRPTLFQPSSPPPELASLIHSTSSSSSSDSDSSGSCSVDSVEWSDEELIAMGLEPVKHLFGPFYIYSSIYNRITGAFESVVFVSLFTKLYGRLAIISGLIPKAAAVSAGTYILFNLIFGAGPVALLAGIIRFIYVLVKDLYQGKSWSEALKHAAQEALKTAIKFFIVYMIWVLAIAALTPAGLLSGGLLPLGILIVGVIVCLGFLFASFLTDKLPGLLKAPKKSWASFVDKLKELKAGVLPALLEGTSWTLMDNDLISISDHVSGLLGVVLDLVGISLVVSGLFFLGAVIHNTISHNRKIKNRRKVSRGEGTKSIQGLLRQAQNDELDAIATLKEIRTIHRDSQLSAATVEYMKTIVMLDLIDQVQKHRSTQASSIDEMMTVNQRSWFAFSDVSVKASSGSLLASPARRGCTELDKLKEISTILLTSSDQSSKLRAERRLTHLKEHTEKHRDRAFRKLQDRNIFVSNRKKYSSTKGNYAFRPAQGFADVEDKIPPSDSAALKKVASEPIFTPAQGFSAAKPKSLFSIFGSSKSAASQQAVFIPATGFSTR